MGENAEKMIAFRTARKGYNREDVHRYIEELNIKFVRDKEALESKITELEQSGSLQEGNTLSRNAENQNEAPREKEEQVEDLKARLSAREAELEDKNAEIAAIRAELAEARARLNSRTTVSTASISSGAIRDDKTFSDISIRLGQILLKANLDADKIIADAESQARQKCAEAEANAGKMRFDAAVNSRVMTEQVKQKLAELVKTFACDLAGAIDSATGEYQRLILELQARAAGLAEQAEQRIVL